MNKASIREIADYEQLTITEKLREIEKEDYEENKEQLLKELNKKFEPFADPKAEPEQTIADWLQEEGFAVEDGKTHHREKFRFYAERNTEKFQRQYVFEVKDYGKTISKLKMIILSNNRNC